MKPPRWMEELPGPLRGMVWMTLAAFLLTWMNGLVRLVGQDIHPFQIVLFRAGLGALFIVPLLMRAGLVETLKTDHLPLFLFRACLIFIGVSTMFWAYTLIPLAEVTALVFSRPLFGTIFAVVLTHEIVRARRWSAIAVGFIGMLVIVRPGFADWNEGIFLALTSAVVGGFSVNLTKRLSRTEPPDRMTFYFLAPQAPLALIASLFFWITPTWPQLGLLAAIAALGMIGQRCFARAFSAAPISAILPLDFLRLPFAAGIGFILFSDAPLVWTWLGGALIFGATFYIARREALKARKPRADTGADIGAGAGKNT